jgi:hypothetical protein
VNNITHITMDTAYYFDGALIAHGWKNSDPDRVERLYRQLVTITQLPPGYEIAVSMATPEMERAGQATGVNAAWSYAKCYRNMLDAQPRDPVPCAPAEGKPIGYMPAWAAAHMSDQGGGHRGWGVNTQIYREPQEGCAAIYLKPQADIDSVLIPTSVEMAQLMLNLGLYWLQQNAPDQLTEQGRTTPVPQVQIAQSVASQALQALNQMQGLAALPDGRNPRDVLQAFIQLSSTITPSASTNTLANQRTALRQALNACATRKD